MRTVYIGLITSGVMCFGVAASSVLWACAALLFAASVGNPIYSVGNQTTLLELGNSENRGSLMTSRFGVSQTALIGGAAAGGMITNVFGPQFTYGVVGLGLLAVAFIAFGVARPHADRDGFTEPSPEAKVAGNQQA
jgi:predicted MFS family arabinose efflux permease